ncbi:MAG: FtsX-like permease family protein [Lysobacter sp.]|nr:MAG: FtsX-like permease family protein [Lysobacter sp.]
MFSQIFAITGVNLKSIPQRWGSALIIVVGLAGVVAVFTALLAMREGFSSTLAASGRKDVAIVMRGGSGAELNSGLSRDEANLIKLAPNLRTGKDGKPLASGEIVVISELFKKGETRNGSNITVRGVEAPGFELRPNLRIVEGRKFSPGLRELLVGRGVTKQFEGVEVGKTLRMRGSEWTVVGVFESGDAYESELWADAETAQNSFGRNGYSTVLAGVTDEKGVAALQATLKADPRLNTDVVTQQQYFSDQTKQFRVTIGVLAAFITGVMALGAIFAALNTMYAAVATRSKEIATLRALGFGGFPVLVSVMIEALVLSLIGGLFGAIIAYVLFDNLSVSTLGANFTQVVFAFKVTPMLVAVGLAIAVTVGFIGGLLPSIRAARMPVTTALRAG